MKGKIIKVHGDTILIRPDENFLDIFIRNRAYNMINDSYLGKEVSVKFGKFVIVNVDGIDFYGEINYEEKK